jgi:hypothetical protein
MPAQPAGPGVGHPVPPGHVMLPSGQVVRAEFHGGTRQEKGQHRRTVHLIFDTAPASAAAWPEPKTTPPTGDEIGLVVAQLRFALRDVHYRWKILQDLFNVPGTRQEAINRYGNIFFHEIRLCLVDGLILALARLTDTVKTGPYSSMSILRAKKHFYGAQALADAQRGLGGVLNTIRDRRDRVIAHLDYLLHTGAADTQPADLSHADISGFIDNLTAIMRTIDSAHDRRSVYYGADPEDGTWGLVLDGLVDALHLDSLRRHAAPGTTIPAEALTAHRQPGSTP